MFKYFTTVNNSQITTQTYVDRIKQCLPRFGCRKSIPSAALLGRRCNKSWKASVVYSLVSKSNSINSNR